MFRTKILLALFVLAWYITSLRTAPADDDVLKLVPHDVLGVVVVNDPAQSLRKWNELSTALGLPMPDLAAVLRQQFPEVAGINPRASVAVAAVPPDGPAGPMMVAWVPVSDFGKLLESVAAERVDETISKATIAGRPMLIARHGAFALVTEEGGEAVLNKTLRAPRSLADDMTVLRERVARADLYAVAPPAGIQMAQQQLLAGLASAKAAIQQQGEVTEQALAGLEMYEWLFRNVHREITHVAAAVHLEDGGAVRVTISAANAADGTLAGLGKAALTEPVDVLEDLPSGDFIVAGGGNLSPEWSKTLAELSLDMMKLYFRDANLTDAQLQEIAKASAESMQGVRSMAMLMGLVPQDQPLYANTIIVVKVDDAQGYLDAYQRSMQQIDGVMKNSDKPLFGYSVQRQRIGQTEGLRVDVQMKAFLDTTTVPEMEGVFEKMFGATDTMSIYLAARDEHTVVGTYISQDRLEQLLARPDSWTPLSRDPQVVKTLAMLPARSSGIGLWSPAGTFKFVAQLISAIEPQAAAAFPVLPDSPPVGVATSLSQQRLDVDILLPSDLLRSIAGMIQQTLQQMQGTQQSF
jgi:hypothetical protein